MGVRQSDRNRHLFLLDCPDLVIVDEAHGAASASERNQSQHQRHEFISAIAAMADRHLILLTATPHSGVESAFRSLLGLLRPEFSAWDTASLTEPQRIELARTARTVECGMQSVTGSSPLRRGRGELVRLTSHSGFELAP